MLSPRQNGVRRKPKPAPTQKDLSDAMGLDLKVWKAAIHKLSLKETGELVRALLRAGHAKRPNRDQRMLLAVFSREEMQP